MNKITDTVLASQFSTLISAVLALWAYLVFNNNILNPNWDPFAWIALIFSVVFMLLPHIICHSEIIYPPYIIQDGELMHSHRDDYETCVEIANKAIDDNDIPIEIINQKPVLPAAYDWKQPY